MQHRCSICGSRINPSSKKTADNQRVLAEHFANGARCLGSDLPLSAHHSEGVRRIVHPILLLNTEGRMPIKSVFSRRVLKALRHCPKGRQVTILSERRENER